MSRVYDTISKVLDDAAKLHDAPWDVGDMMAYVLPDGVVVIEMEEGRNLNVQAVIGKPEFRDWTLGFVQESEEMKELAELTQRREGYEALLPVEWEDGERANDDHMR